MDTHTARLKVGVLFGGCSAEHEISILSARNVLAALDPELFEPIPIAITRDGRWLLQSNERLLCAKGAPGAIRIDMSGPEVAIADRMNLSGAAQRLDVIVPIVHGPMGEDGTLQGLFELSGIPYVGAGVLGSAIGMDKDVMKRLLHAAGLPITRFEVVRHYDFSRRPLAVCERLERLRYPMFVKPANLGSSVGVSRVSTRSQLLSAIELAFAYDVKVLVEEGIHGREIECAVLGNDEPIASVPGEIVVRHADGFYSYDAKYIDDGAALQVPASLRADQVREVLRLSLAAFRVLECSGIARVDFFLDDAGQWYVNEINTLPGFTAISMFPKLWAASGIPMRELLTRMIDFAMIRHVRRRSLRTVPSVRGKKELAS